MHESPDSGEWLAHAHQDLDNGYQALFFVPANFNIKIGPGDEANMNTNVLISYISCMIVYIRVQTIVLDNGRLSHACFIIMIIYHV